MSISMRFALLCLVPAASASLAPAQSNFPLDVQARETALDGLRYRVDHGRVDALGEFSSATMDGVLLPDGRMVDLLLTRLDIERHRFRFHVNGIEQPGLLQGLGLSVWRGTVAGLESSSVMLSFSHVGSHGWIDTGDALVHVIAQPDAAGQWWPGETLFVEQRELEANGLQAGDACVDAPRLPSGEEAASPVPFGQPESMGSSCTLRECTVSLETDFQYYQRFNDLAAQTAYTATLWSYIGDRYVSQANTVITFPYIGFYTTAADPWVTPDGPGTSSAMLTEFRNAWVGQVPNGGRLGHFMSGASLGGGVAWLNVLCNTSNNFAVSGNINASVSFPVVVSNSNWDFMVCAHELGHNFNARHTHDYCPPLDECAPSGYFGACQSQQVCTSQGTIMSYCHLCSGGTANITTLFHTQSAADMTAAANACLPFYGSISGTTLSVVASNTPTQVTATIEGQNLGAVKVWWRARPTQAFLALDMTDVGNGNHNATLPGFACNDLPQYYFEFEEQDCGLLRFPAGAPAVSIEPQVGTAQIVFQDNFQSDLGWTTAVQGATAGQWQRGVPVNDPGWAYDPASDSDGSGACWLTQNAAGNTDVDGGSVLLTSPALDLTAAGAWVEYAYFLRLTIADGADALVVHASANGTGGPWVEVARHNQDRGLAWTQHTILAADIASAGVALGANMRLRFTANDGGTQSIVESGLDAFKVAALSCVGIGANYCISGANSSGGAAVISASGSNSMAANDLVLSAAPVPSNTNGLFFFGANAIQAPFGNGTKCVGSPVVRLALGVASGTTLTRAIDNTAAPASAYFVSGSTWNFQAWFRDAAAGGSNYDLSDGYRVTFTP